MPRQLHCRDVCRISLWSVVYVLNQSPANFGRISNLIKISLAKNSQLDIVQMMAWCLSGTKSISESMLVYCRLEPCEQISVKFESKCDNFYRRKLIWISCFYKVAAILFRPQSDNQSLLALKIPDYPTKSFPMSQWAITWTNDDKNLPYDNLQMTSLGHNELRVAVTELFWFNIVNIMVADALAPYVARTSTPMIFTM